MRLSANAASTDCGYCAAQWRVFTSVAFQFGSFLSGLSNIERIKVGLATNRPLLVRSCARQGFRIARFDPGEVRAGECRGELGRDGAAVLDAPGVRGRRQAQADGKKELEQLHSEVVRARSCQCRVGAELRGEQAVSRMPAGQGVVAHARCTRIDERLAGATGQRRADFMDGARRRVLWSQRPAGPGEKLFAAAHRTSGQDGNDASTHGSSLGRLHPLHPRPPVMSGVSRKHHIDVMAGSGSNARPGLCTLAPAARPSSHLRNSRCFPFFGEVPHEPYRAR
jgi:hypothetical protein